MIDKNNQQKHPPQQMQQQADTASRSLTDALRTSFGILKVIMLVVVAFFLTSGIFRVQQNEKAIILRFGKIYGVGAEQRVLEPGLHWAFPSPVDEIVKIPVGQVLKAPIDSFWYFQTREELMGTGQARVMDTLDPVEDGYCLTRNEGAVSDGGNDYNIVHAKWELSYRITDPERFFRNIYYRAPRPGEGFVDAAAETVGPLLKSLASDAVVATMVNYSIDEAIVNDDRIRMDIEKLLQKKLDDIESGIVIDGMQAVGKITWPRQVHEAFEASNNARQQSHQKVIGARAYAERVLTETGGAGAELVLEALKKPGIVGNERQELLGRLAGRCREVLSQAQAYRTEVVRGAEADAQYLQQLLPEYRKRPRLVLQRIYEDAMEKILDNVDEKFIVEPGATGQPRELRVLINKDPMIPATKEAEGRKEQQKDRK